MATKDTGPGVYTDLQQERQERQRQAQERERQEQERRAEERKQATRERERQAEERKRIAALQAYAQEVDRQDEQKRRTKERERQDKERREREQGDRLAGFTRVDDGVYVNAKIKEIAIKLIITYRNDDELWDFYQNHREELDALIREKIPEISSGLRVKEIQVAKGSIILTIVAVASLFVSVASLAVSTVAAYPAAKTLYRDLKPVILAFLHRWFEGGGPEIQPG